MQSTQFLKAFRSSRPVCLLVRGISTSSASGARFQVPFSTAAERNVQLPGPLVTTKWLAEHMPSVKIIDASWFVPAMKENGFRNYQVRRIPSAIFFDLDKNSDPNTTLPHMLPSEQRFGELMGELGISQSDNIVVYDSKGVFSSPRVWFTFRAFGAQNVAILIGGLPQWRRDGYALETGPAYQKWPKTSFVAKFNRKMVATFDDVKRNVDTQEAQVIDARSMGRFEGIEPELRSGLRSGHIPGSLSVPFSFLIDEYTGALKQPSLIKNVLERQGVDLSNRNGKFITMCGSGVTAAFINLGLYILGYNNVALYDGSWAEWGSNQSVPVVTGPAKKPDNLLRR